MALKRRYAQAKGALFASDLFADREKLAADMAHLGAVVVMFDPKADLAAIKPIRPYRANRRVWTRTALDILRTSDRPLRTWELARKVMAKHGVPLDDKGALFSIGCSLQAVLRKRVEEGTVRRSGKPPYWSAARDD